MKFLKTALVVVILLNIGLLISFFAYTSSQNKVVYVDLLQVYEDFNFKKERQISYDESKKIFLQKMDTLKLNYIAAKDIYYKASTERNKETVANSAEVYLSMESYYTETLDSMDQQFNKEVWSKINELVTQYGEENKYDLIIGASGSGNLMYGKKDKDITKDVIEYINAKYEDE